MVPTRVLLVERDPRTAQLAKDNAKALGLVIDIVISSVEQLLRRPPARDFRCCLRRPAVRAGNGCCQRPDSPNSWRIAGSARTR